MLTFLQDAYITLADASTYHEERGATAWADATEAEQEIAIRKATDYIDRTFSFQGLKTSASQRLKWPRKGIYDEEGTEFSWTGVPLPVQEACAITALIYLAGDFDLDGVVTSSNQVIREKVDVLEVEYSNGATPTPVIPSLPLLLAPFLSSGSLKRA